MVDFLLEVGVEELPADFVGSAISQWQKRIPESLTAEFVDSDTIEIYATPRRLAVIIKGLPEKQPDREEEIKRWLRLKTFPFRNLSLCPRIYFLISRPSWRVC